MKPPSSRISSRHFKDAALSLVSIGMVTGVWLLAQESPTVGTGLVAAVFVALSIHIRLAIGRIRGGAHNFAAGLALMSVNVQPQVASLLIICGLVGAEVMARSPRRSSIPIVSGWTVFFGGVFAAPLIVLARPPGIDVPQLIAIAIGVLVGPSLMLTVAPLAEWTFGHVTPLSMSDWLSYEHPLLRKLAALAPGTFQHSVNVGVLASSAAHSIKADALLARVGGLYHDVGKMKAPDYFIENQRDANPHDNLDPRESARILRAHVIDGVELVTEYRMGDRIADFVREHHGDGQMRLFVEKAIAQGTAHDNGDFRYPGPRPKSRETGLVMIADQLEATARATAPLDDRGYEDLVRKTIDRIRAEGQLDYARLSAHDLRRAESGFVRALQAMYHRRLSYPPSTDDKKRPKLPVLRRWRRSVAS